MYQWKKRVEKRDILNNVGDIFLSYNRKDLEFARETHKWFKEEGINSVWFDKVDIDAGEFDDKIKAKIISCRVFVTLISNKALSKTDGYQQREEWSS